MVESKHKDGAGRAGYDYGPGVDQTVGALLAKSAPGLPPQLSSFLFLTLRSPRFSP